MKPQGIILKKIREAKEMKISEAAQLIGKSIGWLSEIENGKGLARLSQAEFDRTLQIYGGEEYKSSFGGWLRASAELEESFDYSLDGAIYKHMRKQAGITTPQAAQLIGISLGHISKIESGRKVPNAELKEKIVKAYGYQIQSFKNFRPTSSRGIAVPVRYRLRILLNKCIDEELKEVFEFVSVLLTGARSESAPPKELP